MWQSQVFNLGDYIMRTTPKPNEAGLALLNAQMNSLAREIGALDPDDTKRADLVKRFFA
jgi:hypothetical protein